MEPLQILREEPISRLGELPLSTVSPEQTMRDAVAVMRDARRGCVLICRYKMPVGVVTERDVLKRLGASQSLDVPVSAVSTGEVWAVKRSDSLAHAISMMTSHQCRHLPVVGERGEAVGILSVRRIVRALVELFPTAIYNLPPVTLPIRKEREGA
ncbi:inosine 5'-monophosphate dehydrogenase [Planctomycetes bacterium Pan216]|uniref:Inosine 5'-monophosphate dehydrogenase n=1 Tax=Kolteria novifilia TaxID=2527975 RepID=A0A518AXP4_9BACT|nr:inosine 5'-monophosphate dehydrogenase [Planctomycetes bacterium Pan216]